MGNTCKDMAVSFQCMTKFTTNKKKKKETPRLFSIVSTLFYIPTNNAPFLKNHANTCNTVVPDGYEVISHCGFDLYFSNDSVMQSIFSYACSPFVYLL